MVPGQVAEGTRGAMRPVARKLHALGLTANAVTVAGFLITVAGAFLLGTQRPLAALLVLVFGTLADSLDGAIARVSGGGTKFGAFLDSILDRLSDAAILGAAILLGFTRNDPLLIWGGLIGLVASLQVSYVRAKAESLGVSATVGLAPREARLSILLAGVAGWALLQTPQLFSAAVLVVAIISTLTLIQRAVFVGRALKNEGR